MYDIRSAMLNIGIVFTPGKFKINLEKTWKTPGILVNLRSTDPAGMRSMSLRDMQIPKSEKKNFLAPPLPNPGDAPVYCKYEHASIEGFCTMIPMQSYVCTFRRIIMCLPRHCNSLLDFACTRKSCSLNLEILLIILLYLQ